MAKLSDLSQDLSGLVLPKQEDFWLKKNPQEKIKEEIIEIIQENPLCFDIDKQLHYLDKLRSLGALKKQKYFIEERISKFDIDKAIKMEDLRNFLFDFIAKNNLYVDKAFFKKISVMNSKREFKYLMYQLKEKHKLTFEDLERTHKSIFAILTPMGNNIR